MKNWSQRHSVARTGGALCSRPFRCFFFNDTATTEIYTLSLHDALPICDVLRGYARGLDLTLEALQLLQRVAEPTRRHADGRSEEHTSELQSRPHLVCRLLLEKKKNNNNYKSDCSGKD